MNSPNRTIPVKGSHCGYCGSKFVEQVLYPRRCWTCQFDTWANPLPVVVVLIRAFKVSSHPRIPTKNGVVIQQRNIEPGKGKMALPGGYINLGETWQEACAREVKEEIGLTTRSTGYQMVDVNMGSANNTLLVFASYTDIFSWNQIEFNFQPNEEVSSVDIASVPQELAFPSHTDKLTKYLNSMPYYFSQPI